MNVAELENLPESISHQEAHSYCCQILDGSEPSTQQLTLEGLLIAADKQWHTYEVPSPDLRQKLASWILSNWISDSDEFLEVVFVLANNYALEKLLLRRVIRQYDGPDKQKSGGDTGQS